MIYCNIMEDQKLSKETRQAIEDANTGKGLTKYKNIDDFFEKLFGSLQGSASSLEWPGRNSNK